jgi:hypothetical protein
MRLKSTSRRTESAGKPSFSVSDKSPLHKQSDGAGL